MKTASMLGLSLAALFGIGAGACAHHEPAKGPVAAASTVPAAPAMARPFVHLPPMETVILADPLKPVVSIRLVFRAGSVDDPPGKEGLTALTADAISQATQKLSSAEVIAAFFPMASNVDVITDKQFTTISGRVHRDFVSRYLEILTDFLLAPRLAPEDFERLRSNQINEIASGIRAESDEALGKVALDTLLYAHHPYGHDALGTVQALKVITLADVRAQWKRVFTQDRLIVGLAGPVDDGLVARVRERLHGLPATGAPWVEIPAAPKLAGHALILKKDADSVAQSMGFSYDLRRGDPDFIPLSFATSALGEHRQLQGGLFLHLRELRGLNYGTYAYAEHFAQEPSNTYAQTNDARAAQDFSIWIRPTAPENALFATRAALYFTHQIVETGIDAAKFASTVTFLRGYLLLWAQTDERRLGYAIDDKLYGTRDFLGTYRKALETLTPEQVHAAVQRQLRLEHFNYVFVARDAEGLAAKLRANASAPVKYANPKGDDIVAEDKRIDAFHIPVDPANVQVIDVKTFLEK